MKELFVIDEYGKMHVYLRQDKQTYDLTFLQSLQAYTNLIGTEISVISEASMATNIPPYEILEMLYQKKKFEW